MIPNSVTKIGTNVFSNCTSLPVEDNIRYADTYLFEVVDKSQSTYSIKEGTRWIGPYTFEYSSLISVEIPNSVTTIGDGAFGRCTRLSSIYIPSSVTHIGDCAFDWCQELKAVHITDLEAWCNITFGPGDAFWTNPLAVAQKLYLNGQLLTDIVIPNTITKLNDAVFARYKSLNSIVIPNSVTEIGGSAFYDCSSLSSVKIPDSVTKIGDAAFAWCKGLESISLGNSVREIGKSAFYSCEKLTSIEFPNTLVSIGEGAFRDCSGLKTIDLPNSLTELGNCAFQYCKGLTSLTFGNSIKKIGAYTFDGCTRLESAVLPNSVTEVGTHAFIKCNNLKYAVISDNVTEIPDGMFMDCLSLEHLMLGDKVTSIGNMVVGSENYSSEDFNISTLYLPTAVPPSISKSSFPSNRLGEITVIVPSAESESAYRSKAVWEDMVLSNLENVAEVTVTEPGMLSKQLIIDCGMMPAKVVSLKVKGTINEDDFMQMRVNMKSLISLDLSECSITSIPEGAFQDKLQLQSVKFPAGLAEVGDYAFYGCCLLDGTLDLPQGVTAIGDEAFYGCSYTALTMPQNLQRIGGSAFSGCKLAGHLALPETVTELGGGAFCGNEISSVSIPSQITALEYNVFGNCKNLNHVVVPDNIKKISRSAFENCTSLSDLQLPPVADAIGFYALRNTAIESLVYPDKVETLSRGVMSGCSKLVSLTLPSTLKSLEMEALNGCRALRNLTVKAINPPTIADASTIRGINTDKCLICIPTDSYYDYVLAPYWGQFILQRIDIPVESEGNGTIPFCDVDIEVEDSTLYPLSAPMRKAAPRRAPQMSVAENGTTIFVPKGGKIRFYITPAQGETILSATYDGEDIKPLIKDGIFTTTADKKGAKLVVKFSEANAIDGIAADKTLGGKVFNLSGQRVGEGYKGIVIKNGRKFLK